MFYVSFLVRIIKACIYNRKSREIQIKMMTRMCYMMHTGKLDRLKNDIELKTIELGLIIYLFIPYFSFLPFCLSYIHLFVLFLICFVFVYVSHCGLKTNGTLSSDV